MTLTALPSRQLCRIPGCTRPVEVPSHHLCRADYNKRRRYLNTDQNVPAVGTQRRLQALMLNGWTTAALGDLLGVTGSAVHHWMCRDSVRASTARTVAELFARLEGTDGGSDVTRLRAHKLRFRPIEWFEDPDDPTCPPRRPAPVSARQEALFLAEAGTHPTVIADRLGVSEAYIRESLAAAGLLV